MAKKQDWAYWNMGLPQGSEALGDLDAVCEELGLTRGELSRLILITWSRARRGTVQQLWGFTHSVALTPGLSGADNGTGGEARREASQAAMLALPRRKKLISETAAAAAQGLNLDLDE